MPAPPDHYIKHKRLISKEWHRHNKYISQMLFKAVCNLDCDLSVAKRFYWKGHLFWIWTGEWLPLFIMELAWVWLNWEEIFLSTLFWQPLVKSLDIFLICFSLIIGDENQRWYLGKKTIFWKWFFFGKNRT